MNLILMRTNLFKVPQVSSDLIDYNTTILLFFDLIFGLSNDLGGVLFLSLHVHFVWY